MSFTAMLVRTVEILHPTATTDDRGDTIESWPESGTESAAWVSPPLTAEEAHQLGRDVTTTTRRVRLPAGTQLDARDRVRFEGRLWQVDGAPTQAWTPRGEHHVHAEIVEVRG